MTMNVAMQVKRHLPRDPEATIAVIDRYCAPYGKLFDNARSYECFKFLHLGLLTPIKRKSLPEISKAIGRVSAQSLHHFIANSPWSVDSLRKIRWELLLQKFKGQAITVIVDETGDRKKGKTTDYVTR
jgi:SRSO17 transposase